MKGLRVLLVDDESELADALAERLAMRNMDVEAVTKAEQALARIEEDSFDVVVLDLVLEGVHGLDVLRKIRSIRPGQPVILLSGRGSHKDFEEGKQTGAFDYLIKPVRIEQLIEKMKEAVRNA